MGKIMKVLLSRITITVVLIMLQIILLVAIIINMGDYFIYAYAIFELISLLMLVYIISKKASPSFKLPWIILIMVLPLFGGIFYMLFGRNNVQRKFKKRIKALKDKTDAILNPNYTMVQEIKTQDERIASQANYILNVTGMNISKNTISEYFPIGEKFFAKLVEEIKKAKKFIFIEYFIIEEGKMWNTILDILEEKAKNGIEIRVMFDDIGCICTLPKDYRKKLENMGIKCVVFNPFIPALSVSHNNRDHRKITIIDGLVGFTGGINLADEYINEYEKHGYWKDTAIMLKGEAVKNLTILFLQSWNFYRDREENYGKFLPQENVQEQGDGYVIPFGDSPLDMEYVGQTVYMNIINQAKKYVYITTPYLIVDYSILLAIEMAAKRGVDVRIITPHIPDKWYVHIVTQSYYKTLLEAGVKIYEYTPGFMHSKTFVSDDELAVVGTINLDYRSLCHHFECAIWMYQTRTIAEVKRDFEETSQISMEITKEYCVRLPWYKKMGANLIQFFAPLM